MTSADVTNSPSLDDLRGQPYALLAEMDRRLQAGARESALAAAGQTWVGLGFRLGEQWYLAPQQEVREIIVPPTSTRVPGAQTWMLGVANVRGSLLPLIDLGALLGGPRTTLSRTSRFMVFNSDEIPAGFLVDGVTGYRRFLPPDQHHELVATQSGDVKPFLLGAFERDQLSWMVFSLAKLVRSEQFRSAAV